MSDGSEENRRGGGQDAAAERLAPFAAIAVLTFLNSLGSGLLWSGTPFVTENDFEFDQVENLWLQVGLSLIYALAALRSGRLVRALESRLSTKAVLAAVLLVGAGAPWLALGGPAAVIGCAAMTSLVGALLWPIVESYVTSGRHGAAMRRSIGGFNLVWMSATASSLVLMGPLLGTGQSRLALVAYGPLALVSIVALAFLPDRPASHEGEASQEQVRASYPALLRSCRVLLPVSYLFLGALGPLMPYLAERVAVPATAQTPLTASWMVARVLAVLVLMGLSFWHGRASTLLVAVVLLFGGFATAVLADSAWALTVGLVALGAGQGALYHATLYYTMAVGRAAVEAGSVFEALVGLGYLAGPLAALLGQPLGGAQGTVACVSLAATLALLPAVRPLWLVLRGLANGKIA